MFDKATFITDFKLEQYTPEEQDAFFEDFTYELGAAISDGLSDAQMEEFTQIINGNESVITPWLEAHVPDYRDNQTYKELQTGYDEDPERVSPEKVFASIAWVRVNRPDFDSIVARTRVEFGRALAAHADAR